MTPGPGAVDQFAIIQGMLDRGFSAVNARLDDAQSNINARHAENRALITDQRKDFSSRLDTIEADIKTLFSRIGSTTTSLTTTTTTSTPRSDGDYKLRARDFYIAVGAISGTVIFVKTLQWLHGLGII
jgi:hypothetical protein